MAVIGVDLDGVLYDFHAACQRWLVHLGYHPHEVVLNPDAGWHFYEEWDIEPDDWKNIVDAGVDAGVIFGGPIFDGVVEPLRRLSSAGHTLHVVTARDYGTNLSSHEVTRTWLAAHEVPHDHLTFSADKTAVPTDFFIDDHLGNYDSLVSAGTQAFLHNRPWNRVEGRCDRRRVNSVAEFAEQVLAETGI
jgi:5'(3')-deoxyribonucleotidase